VATLAAIGGGLTWETQRAHAVVPYAEGDIFAGVGSGQIKHFSPAGVLLETLDTTSGSAEDTGMCFDATGNLYATNWTAGNMTKFDNTGGLVTFPWGGPFSVHPENCVVDAAGNVYVGEVDGANDLHKFDSSGASLDSWDVATGPRGLDWFDLSADQCTFLYTSEGSTIRTYNVCTDTQGADFATGLAAPCFALRIRTDGTVLVTCSPQTYLLNADGTVNTTYPIGGEFLFAMNLDPDELHFWTGGYTTGNIYKVNIADGSGTGAPAFNAGITVSLAGLAIFGEPLVSEPPKDADAKISTIVHFRDHTPVPPFQGGQLAPAGSVVHDNATVTSSVASVTPTGTVRFAFFAGNLNCSGQRPPRLEQVALSGSGGVATAESSNVGPLAAGNYSYRAMYIPDQAAIEKGFESVTSACEQLGVRGQQ
jgi:hypothetical protein